MAPKPPVEPTGPSLPSTTDFNALYNRISLAAAKQNTFLKSMRSKYPSLQKSASATPPPSSTPMTSAAAPKSSFSSLGSNTPTTPSGPGRNPFAKSKAQLRAEQEDAADPLRFEPPNAGLGYVPSKSESHADAATQELSRRLLGKRARELKGRNQASGAAKRAIADEESDDDEGRSGLGRRKRARVAPVATTPDAGDEQEVAQDAKVADDDDAKTTNAERPGDRPSETEPPPEVSAAGKNQGRKKKKGKTNKSKADS